MSNFSSPETDDVAMTLACGDNEDQFFAAIAELGGDVHAFALWLESEFNTPEMLNGYPVQQQIFQSAFNKVSWNEIAEDWVARWHEAQGEAENA